MGYIQVAMPRLPLPPFAPGLGLGSSQDTALGVRSLAQASFRWENPGLNGDLIYIFFFICIYMYIYIFVILQTEARSAAAAGNKFRSLPSSFNAFQQNLHQCKCQSLYKGVSGNCPKTLLEAVEGPRPAGEGSFAKTPLLRRGKMQEGTPLVLPF